MADAPTITKEPRQERSAWTRLDAISLGVKGDGAPKMANSNPSTLFGLLVPSTALVAQAAPQVVINEIHYDPAPKTEHVEFIELFNTGDDTADLSAWRFSNAIYYTFPAETSLEPGEYLVLTENTSHFNRKFASFAAGSQAFDSWNGNLDNKGERITLVDAAGEVVDEVDYGAKFPWPIGANGDGVSMELVHPDLDNDLAGSWRSARTAPTPHEANSSLAGNPPPQIRQVDHDPKMPPVGEPCTVTIKATDPNGVASVDLHYQVVRPGDYIEASLAKRTSVLRTQPNDAREPNPEYEDPANWTTVAMVDDGTRGDAMAGDAIYTVTLPAQGDPRTLVRYRVTATDVDGASVRVPYADDPSLNFAYFVYDGVPVYEASKRSVHPDGAPYTHPQEVMTSLPVYILITDRDDFAQCMAYDSGDQISRDNFDARSAFNWSGTFVYDGVVYDNIKYRLRQRNARYSNRGKRSMRFRFNRGHYPRLTDVWGHPLPERTRTLNSSKMHARGGYNFGLYETMNNMLWSLIDVPAPSTHWFHFRVVKEHHEVPPGTIAGPDEAAQYEGDFFGLYHALEDYGPRFLDSHNLPDGNLYKLMSNRTNGKDVQRNQGKFSVDDASDFSNILQMLRPERDAQWLEKYVNYEHYSRYHAIVEAVRHYHVETNLAEHLKNRAFYFSQPTQDNPFGRLHTLPWDSDTSWGPNRNRGIDLAKASLFAEKDDRTLLQTRYKNAVREIRDLIWQPDQINPMIDRLHAKIAAFVLADRDRWRHGTEASGSDDIPPIADKVADMKKFAWEGGSWAGGDLPDGEARDAGLSGREGRDAYLDHLAKDGGAPSRPTVTYAGPDGYPVDGLTVAASTYESPVASGQPFAHMEWRLAEVTDPKLPDFRPEDPFLWEWNVKWESGPITEFQEAITFPMPAVRAGRTYRVRVRMTDTAERNSNWSEPIEFTTTTPVRFTTLLENLRISEIMYHPSSATEEERALGFTTSDFEYIELYNASSEALDLRGVRFTKGIDFDFGGSKVTMLGPKQTTLVVRRLDAFVSRYGEGLPIAGEYLQGNESRLNDGGERVKLTFGGGTPIIDFAYNDADPWPAEADGGGYSLVLRSLENPGDLNSGESWGPSGALGGSPGSPAGPSLALHWPQPSAIVYGTPLSSPQLQARHEGEVEGTFDYLPGMGTVLQAGTHTLSVTFTPHSPAYEPVTSSVTLVVEKAPLTIRADNLAGTATAPAHGIDFVSVGEPNNTPHFQLNPFGKPVSYGAVAEPFEIGKYEITNEIYTAFLNAVAKDDPVDAPQFSPHPPLYNINMGSEARGGILRHGQRPHFTYEIKPLMGNKPVLFVSFWDACRFANWLHNGMPEGPQDPSTTEDGAYDLTDAEAILNNTVSRKEGARFFLPNEDEWFKAAHYDPTSPSGYWRYPTRSDTAPDKALADSQGNITNTTTNVANYGRTSDWDSNLNGVVESQIVAGRIGPEDGNVTSVGSGGPGSRSYFGAADMGGNCGEWTETPFGNWARVLRGGSWNGYTYFLTYRYRATSEPFLEVQSFGFRVARPAGSGGHLPPLSVSYFGFVNQDTAESLSTPVILYTEATSSSPTGTYPIIARGATSPNYDITFLPGLLILNDKANPAIDWSPPADIVYGVPLSESQLNARASLDDVELPGNFVYEPPLATILDAGTHQLISTFQPQDADANNPITAKATLVVTPAPLTIRVNDASRLVGSPNPAFSTTIEGFVNGETAAGLRTPISITAEATSSSPIGTYPIIAGGATSPNYEITFLPGVLIVKDRANPAIDWTTPADIVYGTPLSEEQLNAKATLDGVDVPGNFVYEPSLATILDAGTHQLISTFQPQDTDANNPITAKVTLVVTPAPLTIRVNDASRLVGSPNPAFSTTIEEFVNGETEADLATPVRITTQATIDSPLGAYPIIAQGAQAPNYVITYVDGILAVTSASLPELKLRRLDNDIILEWRETPKVHLQVSTDLADWENADGPTTIADGVVTKSYPLAFGRTGFEKLFFRLVPEE